ncbi:MAG: hypothetical protein WCF65_05465 [Parachlamydiaceae bacterium]
MPYPAIALISVVIFACVHLFADRMRWCTTGFQARFLSAGGGIAIAYVFLDLLPKLSKSDYIVVHSGAFPYLERHVYIMALLGFLLFFVDDRTADGSKSTRPYWFSLLSYVLFNFLVGYAIVDKNNPEVRPLALFTLAMGLHYFVNDYSLNKNYREEQQRYGKWLLVASLFLGWFVGVWFTLSAVSIALASAFIGGGVIMNVIRHELPEDNPHSLGAFLFFALIYSIILLSIG